MRAALGTMFKALPGVGSARQFVHQARQVQEATRTWVKKDWSTSKQYASFGLNTLWRQQHNQELGASPATKLKRIVEGKMPDSGRDIGWLVSLFPSVSMARVKAKLTLAEVDGVISRYRIKPADIW